MCLQADEVMHEDDLPKILRAMQTNLHNPDIKGLVFRYLHFVGDYWSTNPWFYHKAVRIIRNNGEVESSGDAVGFHLKATKQYLQSGPREWLGPFGGRGFPYWGGKGPEALVGKDEEMARGAE